MTGDNEILQAWHGTTDAQATTANILLLLSKMRGAFERGSFQNLGGNPWDKWKGLGPMPCWNLEKTAGWRAGPISSMFDRLLLKLLLSPGCTDAKKTDHLEGLEGQVPQEGPWRA